MTVATTRKPTADAKKAETERGDPMAALQSAGLDSLSWFGAPMLENMSTMGSEMLQFFADRIKEDMKTQHEILHCKTPREMLEVQTKFFQKAID